ncbi:MAG: STAS domain-containing protein [Ignavibacteria bacterium]
MPEINKTYSEKDNERCVSIEVDENVVGLNHFNALNDFIATEMKDGVKSFTFDLAKLKTINSSGLGILISCLKKIKDSHGTLNIINTNEKILSILKLTKLNNVFEFGASS